MVWVSGAVRAVVQVVAVAWCVETLLTVSMLTNGFAITELVCVAVYVAVGLSDVRFLRNSRVGDRARRWRRWGISLVTLAGMVVTYLVVVPRAGAIAGPLLSLFADFIPAVFLFLRVSPGLVEQVARRRPVDVPQLLWFVEILAAAYLVRWGFRRTDLAGRWEMSGVVPADQLFATVLQQPLQTIRTVSAVAACVLAVLFISDRPVGQNLRRSWNGRSRVRRCPNLIPGHEAIPHRGSAVSWRRQLHAFDVQPSTALALVHLAAERTQPPRRVNLTRKVSKLTGPRDPDGCLLTPVGTDPFGTGVVPAGDVADQTVLDGLWCHHGAVRGLVWPLDPENPTGPLTVAENGAIRHPWAADGFFVEWSHPAAETCPEKQAQSLTMTQLR